MFSRIMANRNVSESSFIQRSRRAHCSHPFLQQICFRMCQIVGPRTSRRILRSNGISPRHSLLCTASEFSPLVIAGVLDHSATNVMTTLQQLNAKRQVTINRLPIDVLSMISDFIHEDFADSDPEGGHPNSLLLFRSSLSLSHVCRQFRSVTLSTRKLWSTKSNLRGPGSNPHCPTFAGQAPPHLVQPSSGDPNTPWSRTFV